MSPTNALDVDKVRADFPILQTEVHGKPLVYLDNAASAQQPQAVIDAVAAYHSHNHANVHRGVHQLSQRATDAYEAARVKVAEFMGAAAPREVIFTSGATESNNLAIKGAARFHREKRPHVVTLATEHKCVLESVRHLRHQPADHRVGKSHPEYVAAF